MSSMKVKSRRILPKLNTSIGRPASTARENSSGAMSGPAPGAIDGEETQAGRAQAVEVRVGVRDQFVRGLGRRVQRARLVDALVLGERRRRRIAIHRRRTRIHQVLDAAMPAQLDQVDEADQVAVDIGVRMGQRIAHAGLRGEVDHARGPHVSNSAAMPSRSIRSMPRMSTSGHNAATRSRLSCGS